MYPFGHSTNRLRITFANRSLAGSMIACVLSVMRLDQAATPSRRFPNLDKPPVKPQNYAT